MKTIQKIIVCIVLIQSQLGFAQCLIPFPAEAVLNQYLLPSPFSLIGHFAKDVVAVGDFNGNSLEDLAVSAPGIVGLGEPGAAYIFGASNSGNPHLATLTSPPGTTYFAGNSPADYEDRGFGAKLAYMGLVNGQKKLAISAPGANGPASMNNGKIFFYNTSVNPPVLVQTITGGPAESYLGMTNLVSGDINNDGKNDLLAATAGWNAGYYGLFPPYVLTYPPLGGYVSAFNGVTGALMFTFSSGSPEFAEDLEVIGDVNGDSKKDIALTRSLFHSNGIVEKIVEVRSGNGGAVIYSFYPPGTSAVNKIRRFEKFARLLIGGQQYLAVIASISVPGSCVLQGGTYYGCSFTKSIMYYRLGPTAATLVYTDQSAVLNNANLIEVEITALPDLDGDGAGELLVGNPWADNCSLWAAGAIYLGLSKNLYALQGIYGGQSVSARLGSKFLLADVDGDGVDNVILKRGVYYPNTLTTLAIGF